MSLAIVLKGGTPWGFRLQGGKEFNEPLKIAKINPNSKACNQGLQVGDFVERIDGSNASSLCHTEALDLIRKANEKLVLNIRRGSLPDINVNGILQSQPKDLNSRNNHISYGTDTEDYKSRSPTPALKYSNAISSTQHCTISPLDEDQSGSTSDSQSSVINLSEPGDPRSYSSYVCGRNMDFSPCPSPIPSTSVWSPSGQPQTKSYKPVSFNAKSDDNTNSISNSVKDYTLFNSLHKPATGYDANRTNTNSFISTGKGSKSSSLRNDTSFSNKQFSNTSSQGLARHDQVPFSATDISSRPNWLLQGSTDSSNSIGTTTVQSTSPSTKKGYINKVAPQQSFQEQHYSINANNNMDTLKSPQLVKNLNLSGTGSHHEYDGFSNGKLNHLRHGDDQMDSGISSPSAVTARWTPSMTSNATISMDSNKGTSLQTIMGRVPSSPPSKKRPIGMAYRSTMYPPSSPNSQPRNKGLGLFMSQRGKHTDDEASDITVTENRSVPSSPAMSGLGGRGTPLARTLSSPGSPQPVATPFAGLQIQQKSKPIKMVRLKDAPDCKQQGSSLPANDSMIKHGSFNMSHSADNTALSSHNQVISPVSAPKPGVWSPNSDEFSFLHVQTDLNKPKVASTTREEISSPPPVWSPNGKMSPAKQFKSVRIETNSSVRSPERTSHSESIPWGQFSPSSSSTSPMFPEKLEQSSLLRSPQLHKSTTASSSSTTTTTTYTSQQTPTTTTSFSSWNGSISHPTESRLKLPQTQSATVTLLQKGREGQIPRGAVYLGTKKSVEGDKKHTDTFYMVPGETTTEVKTVEKKAPPKFEGIGPTDHTTGMPMGFRTQVDDKNQKDWYKKMYTSLHKTGAEQEKENTYKPTYVFPDDQTEFSKEDNNPYKPSYEFPSTGRDADPGYGSLDRNSTMYQSLPSRGSKSSWIPAHAKYRDEKYRNQPRSIEDYEPGKSSIALKEARLNQLYNPPVERPGQFSKYYESDTEVDFRKKDRSSSPANSDVSHDLYKQIQKGGDIPFSGLRYPVHQKKERSFSQSAAEPKPAPSYSTSDSLDRQRRDEENARRKEQLNKFTEEQKYKKFEEERRSNEARRHKDIYLDEKFNDDKYWMQLAGVADKDERGQTMRIKSPIPLDRYEEFDSSAEKLQRPLKKVNTQIHGKAKALYTFSAQNKKELSFKKGDIIYILNQVDKNWCEGEKHGLRGIFPINYVEILTSLEEAKATALEREGEGRVKYNFIAQTPVELSLRKGDIVTLIRRVDDNWYEGRLGNHQGIFPLNYIEIGLEPETPLMTPLMTPLPSLAPTPIPGSPGQLSPGSTTSVAPTIPTAPQSPRDLESFDFNQPFDFGLNAPSLVNTLPYSKYNNNASNQVSKPMHGYERNYVPSPNPTNHVQDHYYTLDGRSSNKENQMPIQRQDLSSLSVNTYGAGDTAIMDFRNQNFGEDRTFARTDNLYNIESKTKSPHMNSGGNYGNVPNGRMSAQPYHMSGANTIDRSSTQSSKPNDYKYPIYKALYTYMPQNADELELHEGDHVLVMEKCDDGWFVGTSERTKEFGTFPGNYVQLA